MWDSYRKPIRVIRSEEIKTVRQHSDETRKLETVKDKRIKSKSFLVELVKAEFLIAQWTRPIPL